MEDENSVSAAPVNNPEFPTMIKQRFETQQGQTNRIQEEELSVRKLKVFGRSQIFLGFLLVKLSSIGYILDTISMEKYEDCLNKDYNNVSAYSENRDHPYYYLCNRYYNTKRQYVFDIISLICSGWCMLTGIIPFCMILRTKSYWKCLKIAFMVCNIIAASVLVPVIYSFRVIEAVIRDTYETYVLILLSFMTVISFAEVVVAIMAALYCIGNNRSASKQTGINLTKFFM